MHIAVPAAFRRGLQFPRQSSGRQALEFRRRIAPGLYVACALGSASLCAAGAAGEDYQHDSHQRRRGSGRNFRPHAVHGSSHRLRGGTHHQPSGHAASGAEFRSGRHGRPDGGSDAGAHDCHLPHCGGYRGLRPAAAAHPMLGRVVRGYPHLGKVFHLHEANRLQWRTAHSRQRPGCPRSA